MPTTKGPLLTSDDPKSRRAQETFRAMYDKAGLDRPAGQRLNESKIFANRLLDLIRKCSSAIPDFSLARSVLGEDFISPEEIMAARPEFTYSGDQLLLLSASMPELEVLELCKEKGMLLIPGPPKKLSLGDIQSVLGNKIVFADSPYWHSCQARPGWIAIRKEQLPNSTKKSYREQRLLVSKGEYVPNIAEMGWLIATVIGVRRIILFEHIMVRTATPYDRWNGQTYVWGQGADNCIGTNFGWNEHRWDNLGILTGLKL